jgi:hypothetical protein
VELRGFELVISAARVAPFIDGTPLPRLTTAKAQLDPPQDRRSSLARPALFTCPTRAQHREGLASLDKHRWVGFAPVGRNRRISSSLTSTSGLRRGQVMAFHFVEERHDGFEAFFIRQNAHWRFVLRLDVCLHCDALLDGSHHCEIGP